MKLDMLGTYKDRFTEYTELRAQENRDVMISLLNGSVVTNSVSTQSGISARVFKNGLWGFASHPEASEAEVENIVKKASWNANFLASREKRAESSLPAGNGNTIKDFSTKKERLSQKELIDFAREVDEYVEKTYPKLASRTFHVSLLDMEKSLITSDGAAAYSMIPRTVFIASFTLEADGQPYQLMDVIGNLGQFEDVFTRPDQLYPALETLYKQVVDKSTGVYAEAGIQDCILDAKLAGILAHEAIGHTTEADIVLGGSVAADYMNEQVASPLITLTDYAHTALGEICPVPVFTDDEGTACEDAVIIEKGILKTFLHNKETALHYGVKPQGNARAFSYSDEPLIRMRNTAIVPGDSKLEEMIASIDNGYYLMVPSNGQADSTSEFMFGVTMGYEIKNGKLGRAIKDTTISGVAFDVLKNVTMVSDEMKWICGGMCGKKQSIPVGLGGPAIKCQVNVGGR